MLLSEYNEKMKLVLNILAPEITRVFVDKPRAQWFNGAVRDHRKEVRRLERRWRANPREINKQIFFIKRSEHDSRLVNDTKTSYFQSKIAESNKCNLFSVIDGMIGEILNEAGYATNAQKFEIWPAGLSASLIKQSKGIGLEAKTAACMGLARYISDTPGINNNQKILLLDAAVRVAAKYDNIDLSVINKLHELKSDLSNE